MGFEKRVCALFVRLDVTVLVAPCAFALCLTGFDVACRRRVGGHWHALLHLLLIFTDVSSLFVLRRTFQFVSKTVHMVRSDAYGIQVWIGLQFHRDGILDGIASRYEVFEAVHG
jgi:hypothetical protein